MSQEFENRGYAVIDRVISDTECHFLIGALPPIENSGTRKLLSLDPFRGLAQRLRDSVLSEYLDGLVAVEGILFRKSSEHNWAVHLHRDAILPIKGSGSWPSSGEKEGMACAKPPRKFMDRCIAVRVHLDGAPFEDVSIVPGSHLDAHQYDRSKAVPIAVPKGGALIMRPTLAHASSKLSALQQRRVLHFVFASKGIPSGYGWYDAA